MQSGRRNLMPCHQIASADCVTLAMTKEGVIVQDFGLCPSFLEDA